MVPHINDKNQQLLSPQNIGNGLYGLQGMSNSIAVDAVLNAMVSHIQGRNEKLINAQGLGMMWRGLSSQSKAKSGVLIKLIDVLIRVTLSMLVAFEKDMDARGHVI